MLCNGALPLFVASLFFAVSPSVQAQAVPLATGKMVKLLVQGETDTVEGTLSSVTPSGWTLLLADGGTRTFDPGEVSRAEVLQTHRQTWKGALIGGAVGLVTGVISVVAIEDSCSGEGSGLCRGVSEVVDGAILLSFPLLGVGLGGLVGALIKSDEWVPGIVPGSSRGRAFVSLGWSVPVG